jgi:tight adherence protein B
MRRPGSARPALVALVALLALLAGSGATVAVAQQQPDDTRLGIRSVDARVIDEVAIAFHYTGDRGDVANATARVDGEVVEPTGPAVPLASERPLGIALLVESSTSMNQGAAIERAREAALELIGGKDSADRVAVVAFDDEVRVLQRLTTDAPSLIQAVDQLAPSGGTALYDGVIRATSLLDSPDIQPTVLLISQSADSGSAASLERAMGALTASGAALFAVVIDTDGAALGPVRQMADESGGVALTANDPTEVAELVGSIQETLQSQYVLRLPAPQVDGTAEVLLTVGGQQDTAQLISGSRQEGANALRPVATANAPGPAFLRGTTGLVLALVLVLAAVALAVFSLGNTFFGGDRGLDRMLRPYDTASVATGASSDDDDQSRMAQTQLLQRAVQMTADLADRRGILESVEAKLERANLPLRPPEALFFFGAGAIMVTLLGAALTRSLVGAVVVGLIAAVLPPAIVNFLGKRRRKAFEALLPDTLQLLSSTLRAGYSLMQGVEAVSTEVGEPMGRELRRVVTEARLGRPLEESMSAVAERMESVDFGWAVMAIGIQREVGGNLSELLLTVASTMTERERLRRDVSALTAEGRVSAMVLGLLPIGIGVFIMGANPGYLDPLFGTTMGQIMVGGALVLAAVGGMWMKKIIEIEI